MRSKIFPWTKNKPPSRNTREATPQDAKLKARESEPSIAENKDDKPISISVRDEIYSVAFLADGEHIVGGGYTGKIRCWRVGDGDEVETAMDVPGGGVWSIAVSRDGNWIVAGTAGGEVIVWDAESHEKVRAFTAHEKGVNTVDISLDATKIATGSDDKAARVWLLSNVEQRPLNLRYNFEDFRTVKFSPDANLLAAGSTGSYSSSLRFYDTQEGNLLFHFRLHVKSIAWVDNSKRVFVLSEHGHIHCLDVSTGTTLSEWPIHSSDKPRCISLANDGTFIAAGAGSYVSFWDTSAYQQIGSIVYHPQDSISSMAISTCYNLVISGRDIVTLRDLCDLLPSPYLDRHKTLEIRSEKTAAQLKKLHIQLAESRRVAKERESSQDNTIKSLRADLIIQNMKSADLEKTVEGLRIELANSEQRANRLLCAHNQKHKCDLLYSDGRVMDAAKSLLDFMVSINDDVKTDTIIMDWVSDFANKCSTMLEQIGDKASDTKKHDDALAAYTTALSLGPLIPNTLLTKWASIVLAHGSVDEALDRARQFNLARSAVYRMICDFLEGGGRVNEAIGCFRKMQNELISGTSVCNEQLQWEPDFQRRCAERLEKLADAALDSENYNDAAEHYSTILSLNPPDHVGILIKRSKARIMLKSWADALKDAEKAIKLDPTSYQGYEQRHAALHGARRDVGAAVAFDTMMSTLDQSPDERVHGLRSQYVDVRRTIRRIIDATISHMPRVLIDTATGRLQERAQQVEAFEAAPIFHDLVSSMTKEIDHAQIRREVTEFYRYAMFSHRWEHGEPLFHEVARVTVYKLQTSHANVKLQTFCSLARKLRFRWAWSDTCCIDKDNNVTLQESLVAMFAWYHGSSLTIVHLLGVSSLSEEPDRLRNSVWNTRVWTYQEYVAAEKIQFYTEDWKPYLGLTLENHKESPIVLREMEVEQVSTDQVAILRPGLDRVREKLYLASTRETTLVEDIAYSLLGILNASIPIIYGEGSRAVGRLLEYVLTGSGDATILAWTGIANEYNSCLPVNLTVYNTLMPPHIPYMETVELDQRVAELASSIPNLSLATALYDELKKLPSPTIGSSRLRLPGIVSHVTSVRRPGPDAQTYHVTTPLFGDIEVQTASGLLTMKGLCLVHPWTRPLLDQEFSRGGIGLHATTQALRLIVRLRQPFGALLFEQVSRAEYRRVAADCLIKVQIYDQVPLTDLIDSIETIEVQ